MRERTCSIAGCGRPHRSRGWCEMHYRRWYMHGDPLGGGRRGPGSLEERVWAKVRRGAEDECWVWTGARHPAGYGHIFRDGVTTNAHRVVYELLVGPIPSGLELDHLCRNTSCVNPMHMEPVTSDENKRRAARSQAEEGLDRKLTHCRAGHPFDEQNTRHVGGRRQCRACDAARKRARTSGATPAPDNRRAEH